MQPPSTPMASQAARDALAKGRAQVAANQSLAVTFQSMGPGSVHSSQRRARLAVRDSTPQPQPQPQQRRPLPAVPTLRPFPHPDDPIQSQHQLGMLNAFRGLGRLGLAKFIYQAARDRSKDHWSWKLLAGDEGKEKFVYQLLHSLPNEVINSLIRNTLALDIQTDPAVKKFVDDEMMPRQMRSMAGIYINIARRSLPVVPGQKDPHVGKWMTANQVKSLIAKVKCYRNNNTDKQSVETNREIDNACGSFNSSYLTDRRFPLTSADSRDKVRDWLDLIESQYVTGIDPNNEDVPFQRCPMEVGWAQDINTRLKQHINNTSTTPLFGLVNAISRLSVKDGGAAFPKPLQLILFPIWKNNEDLKRIAEILGSVLCSSYWIYGGLNYAWAGGSVNVPTHTAFGDNWMHSADHFHERIRMEAGLDYARAVQLGEHAEKAREKSEETTKMETVKLDWEKKRAVLKEQRAELRSVRAERDEKDRQRKEDMRKKIKKGDEMMEKGYKLYDQQLRRRKMTETMEIYHQLRRAQATRDTEIISELEQEFEGVDADILTEAQAELEKIEIRVQVRREGLSTGKVAQHSEDSQRSSNVIDLTATSQDSQS